MLREFACYLPVQRRHHGLFSCVRDDAICARRLFQVPRSETSAFDCADIPPIVLIIEGIKNESFSFIARKRRRHLQNQRIFCPTRLLSSVLSATSGRGHCSTISKPSGARAAPRVVATVEEKNSPSFERDPTAPVRCPGKNPSLPTAGVGGRQ